MTDRDPTADDTRKHPRYDVEIRVDWSTGRMFISGLGANISEGGVFVHSGPIPAEQSQVDLVLWLPGRGPIRSVGHVVWSLDAPAAGGIRFTDMPPADHAMLLDYLMELATGAAPARGH